MSLCQISNFKSRIYTHILHLYEETTNILTVHIKGYIAFICYSQSIFNGFLLFNLWIYNPYRAGNEAKKSLYTKYQICYTFSKVQDVSIGIRFDFCWRSLRLRLQG